MPLKPESFASNPHEFLQNKLDSKVSFKKFKINNSERYLRARKRDKNFQVAKKMFLDFTDIYMKNYEVEFYNESCILYKPKLK